MLLFFSFVSLSFAEEKITILVSGQSHASLYPCTCPKAPLGGVARRATAIKNIRNTNKNVLLLEAGGSFAGGNFDTNSQTTELDKERTKFYMQSLMKMGYDAFLISSEEFNFGDSFLREAMSKYKLSYTSLNINEDLQPYIIKQVGKVKIAIIGITDEQVKAKTQAQYINPQDSLSKLIREIKKDRKADLIVVLTYLDEKASKELINKIEGVNIWISSNNPFRQAVSEKINNAMLIMPAWQTRSLTKINLNSSNLNLEDIEQLDLSNDLKDDSEIASIIPSCFTEGDCKKSGFVAKCQNAGTKGAACSYTEIKPVKLTVIKPITCKTCNAEGSLESIKTILPSLKVEYILDGTKQAKELIGKLGIKMLPAYLIDQSIEKEEIFSQINKISKKVNNYYVLEPGFTGVSYFTNRKRILNRLDVFFDIGSKDIVKILNVLELLKTKRQDIDIHLNFLAIEDPESGFISKGKRYEIEEFQRDACINKYYPEKLWNYLSCRLSDIESSWWDDCALKLDIDPAKIKGCAQREEGRELFRDFIRLTQELEVVFGPTFVINNQEIFSANGVPTVEELEGLFE